MNASTKIQPAKTNPDLRLAFDVGHSSIGWAVLQSVESASARAANPADVNILGCGSVVFRADDCLASSRRAYRRQRRHIRSTRHRIARMKIILKHLGAFTDNELNKPGCAWPWLLAARVLRGGKLLTWPELWDVLRWYAHNRGYDGNRRWSVGEGEAQKEDSEKEANAHTLMGKYGTRTMSETFCAMSRLDPLGKKKSTNLPGDQRPKGQNAAFPREVVEGEMRKILQAHFGKLKGVDANFEKVLFRDWRAIPCSDLKLPKRFEGGLLFGQLVPRFDNRIISICPMSGQKVPSRNCPEFLNFRWAMQLANIKVGKVSDHELRPLNADECIKLDKQMRERGYLTPRELKDAVRTVTACGRDNLDTMLMHPDAKEALLLDPVQKLISSDDLQPFWKLLPDRLQKRLRGQWRRAKVFSLAQIRGQLASVAAVCDRRPNSGDDTSPLQAFDAELEQQLDAQNSKAKNKEKQLTRENLLEKQFPAKSLKMDGRAAFARHLLKQAYEDILAGKPHPKEEGGCLFITQQIRDAQLNRALADQTNNHLVRHRLLILERLLTDIIKEYADGIKERIAKITIEVNRDLREMSGMTAKEKAMDLGSRIANHHAVSKKLEEALAGKKINGRPIQITAGLIRKGRVADDLGWTCPYTGQKYEPINLITRYVDKDHIVPRSQRPSDGLDSLVVTFSEINKWKGNRTAWQFVSEEQGKPVPGLPNLSIVSLSRYKQFVEGLESFKGHDDDKRRKKKRKELMLLPKYEEKEFTPGDLTQTSQLVRLGAQVLRKNLPHLTTGDVTSLPGSVTGAVRKAWKVLGCLSLANPQVLDENGDVKNKTEIRDITHLHHALDACVLGLASVFIPNNGRVWELIVKRRLNDLEQRQLAALGIFGFNAEKRFELHDLDKKFKEQIGKRLTEKRVVQHIPARMDGLPVDLNMWRLKGWKSDGKAILEKHSRDESGKRKLDTPKAGADNKDRLFGWQPKDGEGKLKQLKAVLITNENFGVALTKPQPAIIPFHKVWKKLQELPKDHDGKKPRVVRAGALIEVPRGNHKGSWRIFSIKNNANGVAFALGQRDGLHPDNSKQNVLVRQLLKDGAAFPSNALTGIAVSSTISPESTPATPN